jgi:hypothetical protein
VQVSTPHTKVLRGSGYRTPDSTPSRGYAGCTLEVWTWKETTMTDGDLQKLSDRQTYQRRRAMLYLSALAAAIVVVTFALAVAAGWIAFTVR